MQFHIPSVVHAVPATIADPVPTVLVLAGAADEATGVTLETTALDVRMVDATGAEVAFPVDADVATVTKTPPWLADALAFADVALEAAAEVTAVVLDPDPEPADAAPVATTAEPQPVPMGGDGVAVARPNCSRESPGFGNARSWESSVLQVDVGMLAMNIFGRALYAAVSRSTNWV
jgi:hypothetical protein